MSPSHLIVALMCFECYPGLGSPEFYGINLFLRLLRTPFYSILIGIILLCSVELCLDCASALACVSCDGTKANYRVEWGFLFKVLEHFYFPPIFIKMIKMGGIF